jgi:WG containing repeat
MKILILLSVLISFNSFGYNWSELLSKQNPRNGKYGFVDSTDKFIIRAKFDQVREFASEYTSVRVSESWGIINSKGKFILRPKLSKISVVYRGHFIESGENLKFRSISNDIVYEYLFIPGPFDQIMNFIDDPEAMKLEDYELYVRVVEIEQCHYYKKYRPYNWLSIESLKYGKMAIDFVLDNPERVKNWIQNDAKFEEAYERGEIGCCSYGPFWWGD